MILMEQFHWLPTRFLQIFSLKLVMSMYRQKVQELCFLIVTICKYLLYKTGFNYKSPQKEHQLFHTTAIQPNSNMKKNHYFIYMKQSHLKTINTRYKKASKGKLNKQFNIPYYQLHVSNT